MIENKKDWIAYKRMRPKENTEFDSKMRAIKAILVGVTYQTKQGQKEMIICVATVVKREQWQWALLQIPSIS